MEQPQPTRSLESTIKFFSIIYIILFTSGILYNYFFFRHFGITITEYIDLSEALLLFIPMLTEYIFGFCLIPVISLMLIRYKQSKREDEEYNTPEIMADIGQYVFVLIGYSVIATLLYIASLFIPSLRYYSSLPFYIGILLALPLILDLILVYLEKKKIINLQKSIRISIYGIVAFVVSILIAVKIEIKNIDRYKNITKPRFEIIFTDKSQNLKSTSEHYYLGRTKNYLFIYNFTLNQCRVLKTEDIKEITFTK